jgi:DNA repair protein RecO (recombination protein O)
MIIRTDGVVLRAFDYAETSRIATVLTRRHGVLGLLAKGARRPTSRFGSTLQAGAHLELVYYFKEGRGLQTLTQSTHATRFPAIATDLGRLTPSHRLLEVVRALIPEADPQPAVLALLVHTLEWIEGVDDSARAANAVPWFQLRLAAMQGFAPDIRREDVLAIDETGGVLRLESGSVHPPSDDDATGRGATRAALRAFAVLAHAGVVDAGRMRLDAATRAEVEELVDAFVQYHAGHALPTRVRRVAGQIDAGLAGGGPRQGTGRKSDR